MPVEMIGWIAPRISSEIIPVKGPPFDAGVIAETARIHEDADSDSVLVGYFSDAPDGFMVGAHAASVTKRLSFLLAHRPGFIAPTVAARKLATLDQLSGGRLAVTHQPDIGHPQTSAIGHQRLPQLLTQQLKVRGVVEIRQRNSAA